MDITGKLIEKGITQNVTATFTKREFVVEYAENPSYPEYIKFELIQDKCALLDKFEKDQDIKVHFNLKGRKWNDPKDGLTKYFNSLQAWRLETVVAGNASASNPTESAPANDEDIFGPTEGDGDDLPF
jgi:predicted nucleic acid-binding protein